MENVQLTEAITRRALEVKVAQSVCEATVTWRSTIEKEIGLDNQLHCMAERAVTKAHTEVMRKQVALYTAIEKSPITYDEAMTWAYSNNAVS